jgi:YXWGXW repeat-containing protein
MMAMKHFNHALLGSLLFAAATASACVASPRGRLYVRVGPPTPIVEARIVAPGAGYVWVPGFYRWDGRDYLWVAGHYELPPRTRARFVEGHWAHDRQGWYFVEGHWK